MTPEQFYFYLKGFIEAHPETPNFEQWKLISQRLNSVFNKQTPDRYWDHAPTSLTRETVMITC